MKNSLWRKVRRWAAVACVAVTAAAATYAQEPLPQTPANDPIAELKARMERLEKENQELRQLIRNQVPVTTTVSGEQDKSQVEKIVADYLKADEKRKKDADTVAKKKLEDEGFAVGSDLNFKARWDKYTGLKLETANKDFSLHIGGRFQLDNVMWDQSEALKPATQLGNLQDGQFFRRVRIQMDGNAWEVFEWNFEYAYEATGQGIPTLDEFWAGMTKIPYIGSLRIGHQKVPQGFEGDSVSSSKAMTFFERGAFADAFYQNFATGVWAGNSFADQRMTYSAMVYRQDRSGNGDDFADGEYNGSARFTILPIYENEGRCLLHLGVSGTVRDARKAQVGTNPTGPGFVRFRARPQMRDAQGDFGGGTNPGNTARLVDTGDIEADSTSVFGTELFFVYGPFSLQAEYAWAMANNPVINRTQRDDFLFNGGYVQVSYFLTGENRGYDRRYGREATNYLNGPFTNAWLVRDDNGGLSYGLGAWEIAARYNYVDLNDGPINGGLLDAVETGVNWYLSPNMKVQFMYTFHNRDNKDTLANGREPGWVSGFGIRTQMFF